MTEFFFPPDLVQYANFDKKFCHVFRASVNFEPVGGILAHFASIH